MREGLAGQTNSACDCIQLLHVLIIVSMKHFLANFIAANATCPECEVNEYCGCETEFECRCGYGFTGVDGSCEGTYMYMMGSVDVCNNSYVIFHYHTLHPKHTTLTYG